MAWSRGTLKTFKTLKNIKIVKQHRGKGRILERGAHSFCCSLDIYLRREGTEKVCSEEYNHQKEGGLADTGNTDLSLSVFCLDSVCVLYRRQFCMDGQGGQGTLGNISNFVALAAHASV